MQIKNILPFCTMNQHRTKKMLGCTHGNKQIPQIKGAVVAHYSTAQWRVIASLPQQMGCHLDYHHNDNDQRDGEVHSCALKHGDYYYGTAQRLSTVSALNMASCWESKLCTNCTSSTYKAQKSTWIDNACEICRYFTHCMYVCYTLCCHQTPVHCIKLRQRKVSCIFYDLVCV